MAKTWRELRKDAREALEEVLDLNEPHPEDTVHEVADNMVPVYTSDLLAVVASDSDLYGREPEELGHGTAGPNLTGIAQGIVYDALVEDLHVYLHELREAHEAEQDAREEAEDLVGKRARFTYPNYGKPDGFPELTARSGQTVDVLSLDSDADPEAGPVLRIRFTDGYEHDAFLDELEEE